MINAAANNWIERVIFEQADPTRPGEVTLDIVLGAIVPDGFGGMLKNSKAVTPEELKGMGLSLPAVAGFIQTEALASLAQCRGERDQARAELEALQQSSKAERDEVQAELDRQLDEFAATRAELKARLAELAELKADRDAEVAALKASMIERDQAAAERLVAVQAAADAHAARADKAIAAAIK